jgi:membrane associated rhomboid family serine protease
MKKWLRRWGFAISSGLTGATVVYVFGPGETEIVPALAAGAVVFGIITIAMLVDNERIKEVLVEVLSLFP